MTALWELVEKVNEELENKGVKAIQRIAGRGRTLYGFTPQSVFDAMNKVFGPQGWGYEILEYSQHQIEGKGMNAYGLVRVRVFLKTPEGEKIFRESFGGSRNDGIGDALKGAVTDAVQKALAMFSVGRIAYEGELGVYYECYEKLSQALKENKELRKAYAEFRDKNKLGKLKEWPLRKLAEFCEQQKI